MNRLHHACYVPLCILDAYTDRKALRLHQRLLIILGANAHTLYLGCSSGVKGVAIKDELIISHLLYTFLISYKPIPIARLCAYTSASLLYWAQTRAPLYPRCRWGVKGVEIEDILITPDGYLFIYAYAECIVLGLYQRFHVILVVNSRTSILRVQIGCKGCKDKSYISYTCWYHAPVFKHLDVMQSISPNNHKVRSDPRSCSEYMAAQLLHMRINRTSAEVQHLRALQESQVRL